MNIIKKISPYRKFQIVAFSIMAVIFFILYKKSEKNKKLMWENARYSIAITEGTTHGLKTVFPFVHYYYYVNGKKYKSSCDIDLDKYPVQTEGGRYLVVFSNTDKNNRKFLYTCSVPDSIKDAPDEGWKEAPFNCNVNE